MSSGPVTELLIPAALMFIMFGLGLGLGPADFRRVADQPRALAAGLLAQLVLVPVVGLLLAGAVDLPVEHALGLVIIAACPGGAVSNLISFLGRGHVALSVGLTAISGLLTVVTTPLLLRYGFAVISGPDIAIPLAATSLRLFALAVLPVLIGMAIRSRWPSLAKDADRPLRWLSSSFLALVIIVAVLPDAHRLPAFVVLIGPALVTLNLATMAGGYALAAALACDARDRFTIAIESGVQNGALAIAIPITILDQPDLAVAPAMYGVLMIVTAAAIATLRLHSLPK